MSRRPQAACRSRRFTRKTARHSRSAAAMSAPLSQKAASDYSCETLATWPPTRPAPTGASQALPISISEMRAIAPSPRPPLMPLTRSVSPCAAPLAPTQPPAGCLACGSRAPTRPRITPQATPSRRPAPSAAKPSRSRASWIPLVPTKSVSATSPPPTAPSGPSSPPPP